MKVGHSLTTYLKINSKLIKDLSLRLGSKKLLEENPGRILFDINCSNNFLDSTSSVMEIKTKINKQDLNKLKGLAQQRKP